MEFTVAVDDYSKPVSKNESKLASPATVPRTSTPDLLRPKKSTGRRVSIDVIDTSLLSNLKSAIEQEEERLEALKEINIFVKEGTIPKSNIFDHVLQLVSKVVQSNYMAVTLIGKDQEQWDAASSGITGDEIPFEIYQEVLEKDCAITFLDAQKDSMFEETNFGYYVGIPLRNKTKIVGVFSVVDYKSIEDFSRLSIEVIEGAGKLIVDQLKTQKSEMDKQRKLMQEVEEQKRLLVLQEELRNRTRRADRSAEASPRRGLIDLEDIYTSWIEEDIATGDQLAHLPWATDWQQEYPCPPIASNDKSRCDAAVFYRSLIEDPTRVLFNEICHMICETLAVPMAIIGTITDAHYFPEASANMDGFQTLPRETALCNYTLKKGQPFVIPDLKGSPLFGQWPVAKDLGFYASAPLCTSDGFNIGTICVCDTVARNDFNAKKQKQLSAFSKAFMRHLEIRRLKMLNVELSLEKERLHKQLSGKKERFPERDVTFVCTDVENSTPLWEHHSACMNIAQKLHDQLIRSCVSECYGYEIGTEGDSFELAFHSAVDAVRWCLLVQEKLIHLSWPEGLLKSDYCKEELSADGRKLFSGLRVRMAVHSSNEFEASMQKVSQRMRYFGAGVNSVRTLSAFASGGQILISDSAFELINGSLDNLGNPFVIDLGTHSLDGSHCEMNVYQILPASLGPTYTTPTEHGEDLSRNKVIEGRTFPLIKSFKLISPSYFDAPQKGNVHMVFSVIDKHTRANLVDSTLMRPTQTSIAHIFANLLATYNGYICHEEHGSYMLAFHSSFEAASWCIETMDALKKFNAHDNKTPTVQMGIHSGKFEDCRPHPLTGRMYYFGAVVNRTARIANKATDGQILVSKELILDLQQTTSAEMKKKFLVQEEGSFTLKGIPMPVSLCSIIKRSIPNIASS